MKAYNKKHKPKHHTKVKYKIVLEICSYTLRYGLSFNLKNKYIYRSDTKSYSKMLTRIRKCYWVGHND